MILKNIEKAPRKLRDRLGKWYVVKSGGIIKLDDAIYDKRVFHIVEKKKEALRGPKKTTNKRRKKINGTRHME